MFEKKPPTEDILNVPVQAYKKNCQHVTQHGPNYRGLNIVHKDMSFIIH